MTTRKILIVDDDRGTRMVIRRALESGAAPAFTVLEAESGPHCLELAGVPGSFAVILLDVEMPGMNGFEVCRALRRIDPDVPVVFITAHGDLETRLEGRKAGASSFLPKPVPAASLLALVESLTHGR